MTAPRIRRTAATRRWRRAGHGALVIGVALSSVLLADSAGATRPGTGQGSRSADLPAADGGRLRHFTSGVNGPTSITTGPDGALWFVNWDGTIGRITTSGQVTDFPTEPQFAPTALVSGPDGALWITSSSAEGNQSLIGRMATDGTFSTYPGGNDETDIAVGPDNSLWYTNLGTDSEGSVSSITTAGAVADYSTANLDYPTAVTSGPDGALWFTTGGGGVSAFGGAIGRITTTGAITLYSNPGIDGPEGITTGPDGAIWFDNTNGDSIGRIDTSGNFTFYGGPGVDDPTSITAGPDGAVWFTNSGNDTLGRITAGGHITDYSAGRNLEGLNGITVGPDGALWFTSYDSSSIGSLRLPAHAPTILNTPPTSIGVNDPFNFRFMTVGEPLPALTLTSGTLPPGLSLSPSGVISGTPTTDGIYTASVTADNGVGVPATESFNIAVGGVPPELSGTPPTDVAVHVPYSFDFTLSGGPQPTTTVTAGSLPPGLTLSAQGQLTGTPKTAGVYTATVTADNGIDPEATDTFTITVLGPPAIVGDPPLAYVGVPVDFDFSLPGQPPPTVAITGGSLPPGLGLSPQGSLTGTPTAAGSFPVALTATNGIAPDAIRHLTLRVTLPPTLSASHSLRIGNEALTIFGHDWPHGPGIRLTLCPYNGIADSCVSLATVEAGDNGTFAYRFVPLLGNPPAVCYWQCQVVATEGAITATKILHFKVPTVTIHPNHSDYYGGQRVNVDLSNFPAGDQVTLAFCGDLGCEGYPGLTVRVNHDGSGGIRRVEILEDDCTDNGLCSIQATDTSYANAPLTIYKGFLGYCGPSCGGFSPGTRAAGHRRNTW